jgi:hypothetical protein
MGHGSPFFANQLADFTHGHHNISVLGPNLYDLLHIEVHVGRHRSLGLQGFWLLFIFIRLRFLHLGQVRVCGISRLRAVTHHEVTQFL